MCYSDYETLVIQPKVKVLRIGSKSFISNMDLQIKQSYSAHSVLLRLLFQCRYIGVSVEALVIEVVIEAPLPPVAALGPIRVELLLANGVCTQKGCYEGQKKEILTFHHKLMKAFLSM